MPEQARRGSRRSGSPPAPGGEAAAARRLAEDAAGGAHLGQAGLRNPEDVEQFPVPRAAPAGSAVACARRCSRRWREPGRRSGSRAASYPRCRRTARLLRPAPRHPECGEQPADLRGGEERIHRQSRAFADRAFQSARAQLVAEVRGAAALPDRHTGPAARRCAGPTPSRTRADWRFPPRRSRRRPPRQALVDCFDVTETQRSRASCSTHPGCGNAIESGREARARTLAGAVDQQGLGVGGALVNRPG